MVSEGGVEEVRRTAVTVWPRIKCFNSAESRKFLDLPQSYSYTNLAVSRFFFNFAQG